MSSDLFEIIHEDAELLAINKPAGLATMGLAAGVTSLFSLGQQYIKQRYQKPGGVYLGIVSRLDAARASPAFSFGFNTTWQLMAVVSDVIDHTWRS